MTFFSCKGRFLSSAASFLSFVSLLLISSLSQLFANLTFSLELIGLGCVIVALFVSNAPASIASLKSCSSNMLSWAEVTGLTLASISLLVDLPLGCGDDIHSIHVVGIGCNAQPSLLQVLGFALFFWPPFLHSEWLLLLSWLFHLLSTKHVRLSYTYFGSADGSLGFITWPINLQNLDVPTSITYTSIDNISGFI